MVGFETRRLGFSVWAHGFKTGFKGLGSYAKFPYEI